MASSYSYWSFAEAVRDELWAVSELAKAAYTAVENEDDPAELSDLLTDIKKRLDKVSDQVAPAIPLLKKAGAALDAIPEFKAVA